MYYPADSVCVSGPCFTLLSMFAILLLLLSEHEKSGEDATERKERFRFSLAKVMFCSSLVLYFPAVLESFL